MNKVLIIGSNGAGKSTFSYALAEKTQLPLIHTDQIYWRGNWKITPPEVFANTVSRELQKPNWIIEGNNIRTLRERLPHADTVFWFEFPPIICIKNIIIREFRYHGKARPDMPSTCVSKLDFSFLRCAWSFNKNNRKRIRQMLASGKHLTIIRFTNHRQVQAYLKSL